MIPRFALAQAEEIRNAFARHQVRHLFFGTGGAILLGFPGTTGDWDLFLEKNPRNGAATLSALCELGFSITAEQATRIRKGDFVVPLHGGPFDIDLSFSPQGIQSFEEAWSRHVEVDQIPVCHPDDIIASKTAANRTKDREALPRLRAFRDDWLAARNCAGINRETLPEQINETSGLAGSENSNEAPETKEMPNVSERERHRSTRQQHAVHVDLPVLQPGVG